MSERLPLPAELLRGRRPAPAKLDGHANATAHRLLDLADRGNYLEAAEEAAELLRDSASDPRLITLFLMGSFVERGVVALPELLAGVGGLLDGRAGASARDTKRLESAVEWLLRAVADRVAFHTKRRDETWQRWLETVSSEQIELLGERCEQLLSRSPPGETMLHKLSRWSRDKLAPAAKRAQPIVVEPQEAEVEPTPALAEDPRASEADWDSPEPEAALTGDSPCEADPDADGFDTDGFDADDFDADDFDADDFDADGFDADGFGSPEFNAHGFNSHGFGADGGFDPSGSNPHGFAPDARGLGPEAFDASRFGPPQHPSAPPDPRDPFDSPALTQLRHKLQGFEALVTRGEFSKAAVIASDIQAAIEDFDPLVYLPRLFARYLRLLSRELETISAHWEAEESTASRVLEQLYRADLEGFIDD
ncbi:hypothetical protein G6O69_15495 [Pseudenhygromyxa sp. WMMC2535]|uniref:type VI secretion system protein IglI family protein n=1 Tax=Pseudenhygromyxa sp. WMMC2535 TaxID=2712867 RepID=UPI0015566F72|nr:type VI secretion system protein IglI family protein [Pseudenhygromyxa sp. WMMC2535]NVB39247.1 hypothetical protein [Pseudenhygromyxa sp. WMMC2535]